MKTRMKKITGQVQYLGPHLPHLGLNYSTIFRDGIHAHLYESIEKCSALGELFIPIKRVSAVRRELNFDIAHRLRGTGRYSTFYREVQKWRATQTKQTKTKPITIEEQHA